jgi:hypothetical protein
MLDVAGILARGGGRGMSRFRPNQSGVGMARGTFILLLLHLGAELSPLGGEERGGGESLVRLGVLSFASRVLFVS